MIDVAYYSKYLEWLMLAIIQNTLKIGIYVLFFTVFWSKYGKLLDSDMKEICQKMRQLII